jgi:ABC-type multidrug transport system fused ATPase/permease subunit
MKHWKLIIKAWANTLISVLAMLALISESARFAGSIAQGDLDRSRGACLRAASLLALASISKFFQQSFLAEVASNATLDIRRSVFEKVLSNDQSYFESGRGPPSGDIAYRIAREAEDTGDCIYALLEVSLYLLV